jgi:hypothetical protein
MNGTIRTITITKHFGGEVRRPKMLFCYDYQNGITYEKEDIIFVIELKLFSIRTINLHDTILSMKPIDAEVMDGSVKISNSKLKLKLHIIKQNIIGNKYQPKAILKDKVYLEMYYSHQQGSIVADETLAKIKAHELQIIGWTLSENQ